MIPLWLSIIISSIIFGFVFHGGYPLWGTLTGFIYALLYVSTKSWSVPVVYCMYLNFLDGD